MASSQKHLKIKVAASSTHCVPFGLFPGLDENFRIHLNQFEGGKSQTGPHQFNRSVSLQRAIKGSCKKNGYLAVRLILRVDPSYLMPVRSHIFQSQERENWFKKPSNASDASDKYHV